MGISYRKLVQILEDRKITSYTIKKDKVVGQSAWQKIQNNENIDMRTVAALCKYLDCQPGDLIEYIKEE